MSSPDRCHARDPLNGLRCRLDAGHPGTHLARLVVTWNGPRRVEVAEATTGPRCDTVGRCTYPDVCEARRRLAEGGLA